MSLSLTESVFHNIKLREADSRELEDKFKEVVKEYSDSPESKVLFIDEEILLGHRYDVISFVEKELDSINQMDDIDEEWKEELSEALQEFIEACRREESDFIVAKPNPMAVYFTINDSSDKAVLEILNDYLDQPEE